MGCPRPLPFRVDFHSRYMYPPSNPPEIGSAPQASRFRPNLSGDLSGAAAPRLLASVIDAGEAAAALEASVDVLDVKDPRAGSLGACSLEVLRAVVALRDGRAVGSTRVQVSAALGDTPDPAASPGLAARAVICGADYIKIGLARVRDEEVAVQVLAAIVERVRRVSPAAHVVAATFADGEAAGALPMRDLPEAAARAGAAGCLVDTLGKGGPGLLDFLGAETLRSFVARCRGLDLLCAFAGSIRAEHLPLLRALRPDFIGARGALCASGRDGPLDPARLRAFRGALLGALERG
jgi:uncharacterized protein (UPF0264 family)